MPAHAEMGDVQAAPFGLRGASLLPGWWDGGLTSRDLQFRAERPNAHAELIHVHSPLLKESHSVSFPPLPPMFGLSGLADLNVHVLARVRWALDSKARPSDTTADGMHHGPVGSEDRCAAAAGRARRWSIAFALQLHGSVADRCTVLALPCALLAVSLNLLKEMYPESALKQLEGDFSAHVHQGFSFVLGFLIVFRTQQAYSRWWEGGTLLQELRGEWFNAFSNLMAFLNHDDDPEIRAKVELFKHKMARLFSLLYGTGIEQVHTMKTPPRMQYIDPTGFRNVLAYMHSSGTHDSCELVLQWIQRLIVEANTDNIIKIAPPILARVYNQLGKGIVTLNRARKIKEFIVPFNLAQLIAVLLIVHWISTAIVCAIMLSNPAMAGLTSFTICWAFWGVNYIAVELENPFGDDSNDLPLVEMQEDMNQSIISLLRPHAIRPPVFDFDAARDADLEKALSMDFAAHENLGNGGSTSFSRFRKNQAAPPRGQLRRGQLLLRQRHLR
ncbi:unnamed protein product [Prorocentrum cordatum]|nr:unnamed protein product [Polarella glacialis]